MKLRVKELREELQKRGLSKIGLKQVLQTRLKEAVLNNIPVVTQVADVGAPADTIPNADNGWFPGSRWVSLTSEENEIEDVTPNGYYAPTNASDSSPPPKKRYNFKETFDCPVFSTKSAVWEVTSGKNNRLRMDGRGKPRYFSCPRKEGQPCLKWLEKQNLDRDSPPVAWLHAMLKADGNINVYSESTISK